MFVPLFDPASTKASTAVCSFRVNVPVLSTQITLVHPNDSTAGSFLTTAFLRLMRCTPRASVTVTTMGRPSGMAATARDTPMVNISRRPLFAMKSPRRKITPIIPKDMRDSLAASASMES